MLTLADPLDYNLPYVRMVSCSMNDVSAPVAFSTVKLRTYPKTQKFAF